MIYEHDGFGHMRPQKERTTPKRSRLQTEWNFRHKNGISKCYICEDCGKMFGPPAKGSQRYCDSCPQDDVKVKQAINAKRVWIRKELRSMGRDDISELKKLHEEMLTEEGPEFTEELLGPVCKVFKDEKVLE